MKKQLKKIGYSLRKASNEMGIAHSTLSSALNGKYPKNKEDIQKIISQFFAKHGIEFPNSKLQPLKKLKKVEDTMLSRKYSLPMQVRQAFGLVCDPFGEISDRKQVWLSPEIRYVRETMLHVAVNGGLLAVVGESGSGKSTLRKDLHERLREEYPHVTCIYPQIFGSEDSAVKGQVLKSAHIMESILSTVAPGAKIPRSPELRGRVCVETLTQSSKSGFRHVLIIEEAHTLNRHTIKHLKRFFEMEDGFKRLLSIVLIGQQELVHDKLRENDATTREVVQRCEVIELKPILDVHGYIVHRLSLAGVKANDIWTKEASDALELLLSQNNIRQTYPLVIGNFANKALALAMSTGESVVNRDVILSI